MIIHIQPLYTYGRASTCLMHRAKIICAYVAARLMSMREERSGKRQRGEPRDMDHSELHSPTVQEIADFLDVEMSPR